MSSQAEAHTIESCDHFGLKEYSTGSQQHHNACQQRNIISTTRVDRTRVNNVGGTFGHMREILKDEGVTGLWRGNSTRMVKVAPACAIMIACYEAGKKVFAEVL